MNEWAIILVGSVLWLIVIAATLKGLSNLFISELEHEKEVAESNKDWKKILEERHNKLREEYKFNRYK